jgi:hypothetical protein
MLLLKRSFDHQNSQIFPNDNKDEPEDEFKEENDKPRLKLHEDSDIYLQRIGNLPRCVLVKPVLMFSFFR